MKYDVIHNGLPICPSFDTEEEAEARAKQERVGKADYDRVYVFPVQPETEEDTGWKDTSLANPRRGYHDYERTITFSSTVPLEDIAIWLKGEAKKHMWFRIKQNERVVHVHAGYDSSD